MDMASKLFTFTFAGGLSRTTTRVGTDTTRTSGNMLCTPPGGARYKEELVDSQGRTASRWGGGGGNEGRGARAKAADWGG